MALQPDIRSWAEEVLSWIVATHRNSPGRFTNHHRAVGDEQVWVSVPAQSSATFLTALHAVCAERESDINVFISEHVPQRLWQSSPIRYGDIDGRGGVAGSESGRYALAWNSGQFTLTIMDRESRVLAYAKEGGFPSSEIGGPLRTPLHWLVSEQGSAFMHAAALELDGRSVLVCGPSGAGKSTFTQHALVGGAQVAGDDYVIVRGAHDEFLCYSAYRTIKSKQEGPPELGVASYDLDNGKRAWVLDSEWLCRKSPICAVAVVGSSGGRHPERIEPAVAARVLSTSTMLQVPLYAELIMRTAASLTGAVPCYRIGWVDSPHDATESIRRMVAA